MYNILYIMSYVILSIIIIMLIIYHIYTNNYSVKQEGFYPYVSDLPADFPQERINMKKAQIYNYSLDPDNRTWQNNNFVGTNWWTPYGSIPTTNPNLEPNLGLYPEYEKVDFNKGCKNSKSNNANNNTYTNRLTDIEKQKYSYDDTPVNHDLPYIGGGSNGAWLKDLPKQVTRYSANIPADKLNSVDYDKYMVYDTPLSDCSTKSYTKLNILVNPPNQLNELDNDVTGWDPNDIFPASLAGDGSGYRA